MDLVVPDSAQQAQRSGHQVLAYRVREAWARQSGSLRLAGLTGILLFAFWVGMGPHWDYPYPLHVDEWFAIGFAQSTLEAGSLEYTHPYGRGEESFHQEMGFHLLLGFVKTTTGLSWMSLYRVAPGVLLALLAFVTYAFGHRSGFGWAAALFVPLIPTSIRTLGPSFLVPVSVAMLFIPVTLLVILNSSGKTTGKALWLLLIIVGGTVFVHPPTEVAVTALVVLSLASFLAQALMRKRYREGARVFVSLTIRMLIPVVILGLWLPSVSKRVVEQSISNNTGIFSRLGVHTGFLEAFGVLAVVVSVVGVFFFLYRGEYGVQSYILPVFTVLLLGFLLLFETYQLGPDILYDRGWLYLGLLMAIFSGYGIAVYFRSIPTIGRLLASPLSRPYVNWAVVPLWVMGITLVAAIIITGVVSNVERRGYPNYYRLIDESMFADMRWMGDHTTPGQVVAIGESSLGWAYPPVAGPGSASFQAASYPWSNKQADRLRSMMASGRADVPWLRKSGVSVFYSCWPGNFRCRELSNHDLFKVRQGVYLVPVQPDTR